MQKRNLLSLCLFTLLFPSLSFALTKKDVLKSTAITGTDYSCLYYADGTKVGSVNKKGKIKTASFSKVKKELNKEKNNYQQKMKKEKNASKKKQYKKLYKKYDKAVSLVEDCQTADYKDIACQIHEYNGFSSKNKKSSNGVVNQKILNGQTCNERESRVAQLFMIYENGAFGLCSGTLVKGNVILTAAHCLMPDEDGWVVDIYAWIGGMTYQAIDYNFNLLYLNGSEYAEADLGYVVLETSLPYKPMPLVSKRANASRGTIGAIEGYGRSNLGSSYYVNNGDLKAGFVTIEGTTANAIVARFQNIKSQSNICDGDSGGPLTIYENGEWRLFGIAHGGTNGCGLRTTATSWWSRVNSEENAFFLESTLGNVYSKK